MTKRILIYFVVSRITFFIFALLSAQIIPLDPGYIGRQFDSSLPYLTWIWANFDGRHFLNIATADYQRFDFAYFPLYPFLIKMVHFIWPISPLYIGILVSALTFLAAMFVIYKIVRLDFKENITRLTLFFLAFFPFAFFYHVVYADSLFLLLSTLSFYFARKGKWVTAGIFGGLTTLTRISGLALAPALVLEWYLQNKKSTRSWKKLIMPFLRQGFFAAAITGAGLLVYMAYLGINFGDPLLFQKAMVAWRQNEFVFPPQVIFRYLKIFLSVDKSLLVYWAAVLEFVSLFLYLGLAAYVWRKIRASYGVFMVALLLLVTFTGTFAGTQRFLLHLFPGFLGMAFLVGKKKFWQATVTALFLILGFILTGLFTRGYFVA